MRSSFKKEKKKELTVLWPELSKIIFLSFPHTINVTVLRKYKLKKKRRRRRKTNKQTYKFSVCM